MSNQIAIDGDYGLTNRCGFTDGNERHCTPLDVVEYRYDNRRGILFFVSHDGEAQVIFRDTLKTETVKWKDLCKVPSIDEGSE